MLNDFGAETLLWLVMFHFGSSSLTMTYYFVARYCVGTQLLLLPLILNIFNMLVARALLLLVNFRIKVLVSEPLLLLVIFDTFKNFGAHTLPLLATLVIFELLEL